MPKKRQTGLVLRCESLNAHEFVAEGFEHVYSLPLREGDTILGKHYKEIGHECGESAILVELTDENAVSRERPPRLYWQERER